MSVCLHRLFLIGIPGRISNCGPHMYVSVLLRENIRERTILHLGSRCSCDAAKRGCPWSKVFRSTRSVGETSGSTRLARG